MLLIENRVSIDIDMAASIKLIQSVALCPDLSTGDFRYVNSHTSRHLELHADLDMLLSVENAGMIAVRLCF